MIALKIALTVIIFLMALIFAAFLVYLLYAVIVAILDDKQERKYRRKTR